jgi:hypothetical protein
MCVAMAVYSYLCIIYICIVCVLQWLVCLQLSVGLTVLLCCLCVCGEQTRRELHLDVRDFWESHSQAAVDNRLFKLLWNIMLQSYFMEWFKCCIYIRNGIILYNLISTLSKYNITIVSPFFVSTRFTFWDICKLGRASESTVKPDGSVTSMTAMLLSFTPCAPINLE